MTDCYNNFLVILEQDIRDNDAQSIIAAIKCLRGVLDVIPNEGDFHEHVAEARIRQELTEKLFEVLYATRLE